MPMFSGHRPQGQLSRDRTTVIARDRRDRT